MARKRAEPPGGTVSAAAAEDPDAAPSTSGQPKAPAASAAAPATSSGKKPPSIVSAVSGALSGALISGCVQVGRRAAAVAACVQQQLKLLWGDTSYQAVACVRVCIDCVAVWRRDRPGRTTELPAAAQTGTGRQGPGLRASTACHTRNTSSWRCCCARAMPCRAVVGLCCAAAGRGADQDAGRRSQGRSQVRRPPLRAGPPLLALRQSWGVRA